MRCNPHSGTFNYPGDGVIGCTIPRHRLYPGLNWASLDYTRVYYVVGQFIPRGMNWPGLGQFKSPGPQATLSMISGVAWVSGARGQTSGEPPPPLVPLPMTSAVLNAAHSS